MFDLERVLNSGKINKELRAAVLETQIGIEDFTDSFVKYCWESNIDFSNSNGLKKLIWAHVRFVNSTYREPEVNPSDEHENIEVKKEGDPEARRKWAEFYHMYPGEKRESSLEARLMVWVCRKYELDLKETIKKARFAVIREKFWKDHLNNVKFIHPKWKSMRNWIEEKTWEREYDTDVNFVLRPARAANHDAPEGYIPPVIGFTPEQKAIFDARMAEKKEIIEKRIGIWSPPRPVLKETPEELEELNRYHKARGKKIDEFKRLHEEGKLEGYEFTEEGLNEYLKQFEPF